MNIQRFFQSCIGFELVYNCSCIRNLSLTKQIENKKMWLRLVIVQNFTKEFRVCLKSVHNKYLSKLLPYTRYADLISN